MKKILFTLSILLAGYAIMAQDLAPDQNPHYKISMDKYAATQVSLQTTNNTTVQETYKAYDWSAAKAERKAERRNFRRERVLFNNYNNGWNNNNRFNNNWNNNWNNSWDNNNLNNNYTPFRWRW